MNPVIYEVVVTCNNQGCPKECLRKPRNGQVLKKKKGWILGKVAGLAILWAVWIETYKWIFEDVEDSIEFVWDKMKFWVAVWLKDVSEFKSLVFYDLTRDWEAVLQCLSVYGVLVDCVAPFVCL